MAAAAALALALGAAAACAQTAGPSAGAGSGTGAAADTSAAAGAYVVRPGDSLTAIARRFGVTLDALARANSLDPAKPLPIGVELRLPPKWCRALRLKVQAGDSLWTVSARYGLTRERLAAANRLQPGALLILGATLTIPARPCPAAAGGTTPAAAPAPTRVAPAPAVQQGPALSGSALQVLRGKLAAAATDPALPRSLTGVSVVDLRTGETIYEQNAATPLAPASTEKLPLLVTALGLLGPGFRTHTDVLAAAPIVGGVLGGDIVLKGYGDPRLSADGLARLARAVRSLGVTSVSGSVVADESAFDTRRTGPGWKARFLGDESPPLSALVVDGRAGPAGPAATAAMLFTRALQSAGTVVSGAPRVGVAETGARVLTSIDGPSLAGLAGAMGTWSDNYVAETTLKLLGLRIAGSGTSAAGAGIVTQRLAALGVPTSGVVIADGSGLSYLDRIPACTLASLLAVAARDSAVGPTLRQSLALGGVTGTLRHRLKSGAAAGIVHAKTGTTDGASALAGYVGDRYAFAVISNANGLVDQWAAHALQDRVVETLAESLR